MQVWCLGFGCKRCSSQTGETFSSQEMTSTRSCDFWLFLMLKPPHRKILLSPLKFAIKSCDKAQHLLQELVCRFPDGDKAYGGLAGALHNWSPKLRSRFKEVAARSDELATLS